MMTTSLVFKTLTEISSGRVKSVSLTRSVIFIYCPLVYVSEMDLLRPQFGKTFQHKLKSH